MQPEEWAGGEAGREAKSWPAVGQGERQKAGLLRMNEPLLR